MEEVTIYKGTPQDREDIIDFANYVFSHSYRPHDFIRSVPRLYGEGQHTEGYHYLVKENGKIKAMLCAEPRVLQVGEYSLKMNYIGTVSVHPYARNKGYMKLIMQQMLNEAEENGCVLSALGGQRNRYGYYGYEMGGMKLSFSINDKNIRHYCRDMQKLFTFTEIKEQDEAVLDKVFELCNRQEIKMSRPRNEIFCMLHEWDSTPYAVMENDIFKGYLILADNNLLEMRLEGECLLPQVLYSLFAEKNLKSIQIMAADYETERLAALYDISENYRIETSDNIRIFDYSALMEAFLKMKAEKEGLLEGKINLEIDQRIFCVEVSGGKVQVVEKEIVEGTIDKETIEKETIDKEIIKKGIVEKEIVEEIATEKETDWEKSDISLTGKEAVAFLTAPFSMKRREAESRYPFLRSWFPLPLCIPVIDAC